VSHPTDGGPIAAGLKSSDQTVIPFGGLSIRDYFAGLAMSGHMANPKDSDFIYCDRVNGHLAAARAYYRMADGMLLARQETEVPA